MLKYVQKAGVSSRAELLRSMATRILKLISTYAIEYFVRPHVWKDHDVAYKPGIFHNKKKIETNCFQVFKVYFRI